MKHFVLALKDWRGWLGAIALAAIFFAAIHITEPDARKIFSVSQEVGDAMLATPALIDSIMAARQKDREEKAIFAECKKDHGDGVAVIYDDEGNFLRCGARRKS